MSRVQYFSNCFNFREHQKSVCFAILIAMTSFAFDVYSYYRNQIIYGVVLSSRPFLSPSETWKLLRRISDRRGYLNRFKQHVNVKGIYEVSQFSSVFVSDCLCPSQQQLLWLTQLSFSEETDQMYLFQSLGF